MEVALRRRLEGVADITISQRQQTAEVTFDEGDHAFSPRVFREAIGEANVRVVRMEVDACGTIEKDLRGLWLAAGKNRWLAKGEQAVPSGKELCVSGRLDDSGEPPTLEILATRSAQ